MARILIADDDAAFRGGLAETLADAGHRVVEVADGHAALLELERERLDAAIIDLRMPGLAGLQVLARRQQRGLAPGLPVIVLTGFAEAENTIEAMRLGAFDHMSKPIGRERLLATLDAALAAASLDVDTPIPAGDDDAPDPQAFIGSSGAMREVHKRIGRATRSQAAVLVTGETGSGKELVARALHRHGTRASGPFVAINCAAIPAELLESELFGHVKGAFSGAHADRAGRFEQAHRGVLFLDEIGDMPLLMQAKLLRVLQEHEITPVGSGRSRRVDVRVVAATHRDLEQAVLDGQFRADLRFRLDVLRIHLPALRERLADVLPLAEHFLRLGAPGKRLSREAAQRLMDHDWPGNVRELRNVIERAAAAARTDVLRGEDIDLGTRGTSSGALGTGFDDGADLMLPQAVERLERRLIGRALQRAQGNRTEAARLLGIRRQLLYAKLAAFGMETGST